MKVWGERAGDRALAPPAEGSGMALSTQSGNSQLLQLQLQAIWHLHLPFTGTCMHVVPQALTGTHMYISKWVHLQIYVYTH